MTIHVYRQEGKTRKIVCTFRDVPLDQVIRQMEMIADEEGAIKGTRTLHKKDKIGCSEFHVGDVVFSARAMMFEAS